jgi:hypothetical protein
MQYQIVSGIMLSVIRRNTPSELERKVRDLLCQGWRPIGGVTVVTPPGNYAFCPDTEVYGAQVMIRDSNDPHVTLDLLTSQT